MTQGEMIVMTPLKQGAGENVIRVERERVNSDDGVLHVAGGEHTGIVIRKPQPEGDTMIVEEVDLQMEFKVYLVEENEGSHKQENRQLRFWFHSEQLVNPQQRHHTVQDFFKNLLSSFPSDYLGFIKRVLKLMQQGYPDLRKVELDMKLVDDKVVAPVTSDYVEGGQEVESITSGHVQDVLETAYPNGLSVEAIATALRATQEEIYLFLEELQERNLVQNLESGEWLRVEASGDTETALVKQMPKVGRSDQPTVAIITALFVEKLAVDAMIENKQTFMRYKTDGESNVYTLGNIGNHRVVATKLSAVGHSRAAMIAAGSITTRLLGGFQHIQHVIVVGVGGAVPSFTDAASHVRLGDVVVSSAPHGDPRDFSYVYCDKIERNRETGNVQGYAVKTWSAKDKSIPAVVAEMINECDKGESNGQNGADPRVPWSIYAAETEEGLKTATASSDYTFDRPPPDTDVLTLPLGEGNVATVGHPDGGRDYPRIHLGPVGAGRAILRDPLLRAEFAQRFSLKAYDADFDSVVESIFGNRIDSWAVIRGVSDYGDGMRNKEWQAYAALQAAACTKLIVNNLPLYDE